jgi:hypothetical protein
VAGALVLAACGGKVVVDVPGGAGGSGGFGGTASTGQGGASSTCMECACELLVSQGGCGDVCDDTKNGTPNMPNFCNGAPAATAQCAECLMAACGIINTMAPELCL